MQILLTTIGAGVSAGAISTPERALDQSLMLPLFLFET